MRRNLWREACYRYAQGRSTHGSSEPSTPRMAGGVVTFDAAYGSERVIAHLYLPKSASPPYQTIVSFPEGNASLRSSRDLNLTNVDFDVRSGRVPVFPMYQGPTKGVPTQPGHQCFGKRYHRARQGFGPRSRLHGDAGAISIERFGFYGVSLGANTGRYEQRVFQTRLKAPVVSPGGLL